MSCQNKSRVTCAYVWYFVILFFIILFYIVKYSVSYLLTLKNGVGRRLHIFEQRDLINKMLMLDI